MEEKKEEGKEKHHLGSRRFVIAVLAIICCTIIGLYLADASVVTSIAIIAAAVAGAGAVGDLKK
jgi:uncharacterized membrane protein